MTSPDTAPLLSVQDLHVSYGRGKKKQPAVKGISFEVYPGECVGFIGHNGAGKSTTLKVIMGFRYPDSGKVEVFGEPSGLSKSRERMGYLPEVSLYYPFLKARELLELYGGLSGLSKEQLQERIPGLLEKVGLEGRGENLLKEFSKGMQQRLGIAQSLIAEPELLIYDELSSGLDPLGRYDLRALLQGQKEAGTTIFFSSHELNEVESLCDRVIMIHQGTLLRDLTLEDLKAECGDRSLEQFYIDTLHQENDKA